MKNRIRHTRYENTNAAGIVLLVTLVLLVVLATLGYTISARLTAQRHRNQYIIDYQAARYACDSAVKYALATLEDIQPQLISRPNEPDFSDLFRLTEPQYQQLLAQLSPNSLPPETNISENPSDFNGPRDFNDVNDINNLSGVSDYNDLDSLKIRGPYGPPWPLVTEPVEFQIGPATVKIEIEDENAKFPLGWALLEDKQTQQPAKAAFETFCEWMGIDNVPDISLGADVSPRDLVIQDLKQISKIRPFQLDFKPITRIVTTPTRTRTTPTATRGRRILSSRSRAIRKTVPITTQISEQTAHFARIFHSSLFETATEILARPTIVSETRKESALKYLGTWGSRKVNINTAPRHVLEAAFTFGGPSDAPKIAEQIIQRRRLQPFKNIEDLRQKLFGYSDSIRKCERYITTKSSFFTIKVTALSGVAEASSVIAVTKAGKTIKRLALVSM